MSVRKEDAIVGAKMTYALYDKYGNLKSSSASPVKPEGIFQLFKRWLRE